MNKLVLLRQLSQLSFLCAFIYLIWVTTYPLQSPVGSDVFFKADPLVMFSTSISSRELLPGTIFSVVMVALTALVGRFFCGWLCPLGTAIDVVGSVRRDAHSRYEPALRVLRPLKYWLLAAVILAALLGMQYSWALDPIGISARFISLGLIPEMIDVVDSAFILALKSFGSDYPGLYDIYHSVKYSILAVNTNNFPNAGAAAIIFLTICGTALLKRRLWCRAICPLGAIYSLFARFSPLRITTECVNCKKCRLDCRMGAVNKGAPYTKGECILCMDCLASCPKSRVKTEPGVPDKGLISRRDFMFLMASPMVLAAIPKGAAGEDVSAAKVLRPPTSLREAEFLKRCIRCGNCMRTCVTNGLQPTTFESGFGGIWTPHLVPEIGYCEYNCNLCGKVCPTGALKDVTLDEKHESRIGLAKIDKSTCLAWAQDRECIVCEEHCPIPQKAIKVEYHEVDGRKVPKPYVDESLCVGCGICQNKCPVRPVRAIRVSPIG
jgi:MauM/NapG family ferredoxin protein